MTVSSPRFIPSFPGRTTLTSRDRIVVRAIAEAMFSQDGEVEHARLDAHVLDVDAFVSSASKMVRTGLRIALFVVRIAPLLMFFRLRTIEQLPVDERVALLSRLERSRLANLSLAFIGWRTVMTLIFYEHPSELRQMGYASDERVRHKRHLPAFLPIAAARAVPAPQESGVRLRDPDSIPSPAAGSEADSSGAHTRTSSGSREVA